MIGICLRLQSFDLALCIMYDNVCMAECWPHTTRTCCSLFFYSQVLNVWVGDEHEIYQLFVGHLWKRCTRFTTFSPRQVSFCPFPAWFKHIFRCVFQKYARAPQDCEVLQHWDWREWASTEVASNATCLSGWSPWLQQWFWGGTLLRELTPVIVWRRCSHFSVPSLHNFTLSCAGVFEAIKSLIAVQ